MLTHAMLLAASVLVSSALATDLTDHEKEVNKYAVPAGAKGKTVCACNVSGTMMTGFLQRRIAQDFLAQWVAVECQPKVFSLAGDEGAVLPPPCDDFVVLAR